MLCHWVNYLLNHYGAFIFRPRHFFLDFSTSEDEGTMILQKAGNYSHNDSLKTQKTWILSNETNNSFKLRYITKSLMEHNQWKGKPMWIDTGQWPHQWKASWQRRNNLTYGLHCEVTDGFAFSQLCDTKYSTDRHSYISENESPWSSYIPICCGHQRTFHSCNISDRGHTTAKIRNPLKNLRSSQCLFSKSYCHHSKVPVASSPHFKPKSDACPLFLQICCLLRHTTIPTVTAHTPLVHNSAPLRNHMRYSPTSNSKSLSRLYLLTANSSCVTSRSVHKSSDHTMHLPEHKTRILF